MSLGRWQQQRLSSLSRQPTNVLCICPSAWTTNRDLSNGQTTRRPPRAQSQPHYRCTSTLLLQVGSTVPCMQPASRSGSSLPCALAAAAPAVLHIAKPTHGFMPGCAPRGRRQHLGGMTTCRPNIATAESRWASGELLVACAFTVDRKGRQTSADACDAPPNSVL